MAVADIIADLDAGMNELQLALNNLAYADANRIDGDVEKNVAAEGIFLRGFTIYERTLDRLFLAYCTGSKGLDGAQPTCRLANCDEAQALAIAKNGFRFLDWSSPKSVRERADLFFLDGEPFRTGVDPRATSLSEMEKIRNRIAHFSPEAELGYLSVQRALFGTERVFEMSPGQLLRTRRRGKPPLMQAAYFLSVAQGAAHAAAKRP